jgi:hypothetical protein
MAILLIGPENEISGLDFSFHRYVDKLIVNFCRTHWGFIMVKNLALIRGHVNDEM